MVRSPALPEPQGKRSLQVVTTLRPSNKPELGASWEETLRAELEDLDTEALIRRARYEGVDNNGLWSAQDSVAPNLPIIELIVATAHRRTQRPAQAPPLAAESHRPVLRSSRSQSERRAGRHAEFARNSTSSGPRHISYGILLMAY